MERILTILLLATSLGAYTQVAITTDHFDFGTLHRADEGFADFEIKNDSEREVYIFRVEVPRYVDVAFSAKTILPGESEFIRLKYNPPTVGVFKEKFEVFTSAWEEPQTVALSGEATFAADRFLPCPDFSNNPVGALRPFSVTTRTLDNRPAANTVVFVFNEGESIGEYTTDVNGELDLELPLGKYFFSMEGLDTALYINATNDHLVAFLDKPPLESPAEVTTKRPETVAWKTQTVTSKPETIEEPEAEVQPREDPNSELPLSEFKPNNLVFLVDVSTSMKHNGKLDLLKVAMIRLVDMLREVDRFTLISYATDSGIILKTDGGLDKEACKRAIGNLTAGGKTEGANALNNAGRAALDYYIEEGNNQVILATDGAFNEGADKAQRLSAKYNRKGIVISVVGIKCGKFTTREMTELADQGGGSFIPLNTVVDANRILLDEVKLRSSK